MQNTHIEDNAYIALAALKKSALITINKDVNQFEELKIAQNSMRENYAWIMKITNEVMLQKTSIENIDEQWLKDTFHLK